MGKKIKAIDLDPTLNWEIGEILNTTEQNIEFKIINKKVNNKGNLQKKKY